MVEVKTSSSFESAMDKMKDKSLRVRVMKQMKKIISDPKFIIVYKITILEQFAVFF